MIGAHRCRAPSSPTAVPSASTRSWPRPGTSRPSPGLGAVSLHEVARRVGIRQPSLYGYVSSKLDLYDAMFAQAYEQLLARLDAVTPSGTAREQLLHRHRGSCSTSWSRTRRASSCCSSAPSPASSPRRRRTRSPRASSTAAPGCSSALGRRQPGPRRRLHRARRRPGRPAGRQRPRRRPLDPPPRTPARPVPRPLRPPGVVMIQTPHAAQDRSPPSATPRRCA